MKVTNEINTWAELFDASWSGARDTLKEIERQGREEEAMELLEEYFDPAVYGSVPSNTEVNDYIWFSLQDDMHLYDDEEE